MSMPSANSQAATSKGLSVFSPAPTSEKQTHMKTSALAIERISRFLHAKSGICLTKDNEYLIDTRLSRVARLHKIESIDKLSLELAIASRAALAKDVVEAMTTNETLFFRDDRPFTALRKTVLPLVRAYRGLSNIRIYSAAASTGQESYSIAMSLDDEMSTVGKFSFEILGTDIDSQVLEKAKLGIYSQFEVQRGVPALYLVKYFDSVDGKWRVKPSLKNVVTFREFNLLNNMSHLGTFDIIFCRNVLIYFDSATKANIVERIAGLIAPGGFLFVGSAEYITVSNNYLSPFDGVPGLYQRR
jgi:chemotaxis protein methyltransferase CheR